MSVRTSVRGYREREGDRWVDNQTYAQALSCRMQTEGVWLRLGAEFGERSSEALFAAANALANAYTILKPCEPTDVAATAVLKSADGSSRIYLYDNVAGGLAITQDAYDRLPELLAAAADRLENCSTCINEQSDEGCPGCAQSSYSYETHQVSRTEGAELLRRLVAVVELGATSRQVSETYKRRVAGMLTSVSAEALREEVTRAAGSMARRYFPVGSLVRTVTGYEGRVIETYLDGRDRAYVLQGEDGRGVKQFRDTGANLALADGELQKECLGCGVCGLDWDEDPCPNCDANLRMA